MAKPEWGTKRSCEGCGAKFYDFQRDPIICPKCDTKFTLPTATRSRRNRSARPEPVAAEKPKVVPGDEAAVVAGIDDIADDDIADDDDTGDDALLDDDDDDDDIIGVPAGDDLDEKGA